MHGLDEQGMMPAGEEMVLNGNSLDLLLQPEFQNQLSESARTAFQAAIADSVSIVFWIVLLAAIVCLGFCTLLQSDRDT